MKHADLIARLRTDPIFDNSTLGNEAADALEQLTSGEVAVPEACRIDYHSPGWSHCFQKDTIDYGDRRAAAAVLAERDRLADILLDDSYARAFQSVGQYRTALLNALRKGSTMSTVPELKRLSDKELSDLWFNNLDPRAFGYAIMDKLGVPK